MGKPSLTTVQSIVAVIAGLTSIVGGAYSAVGTLRTAPPPSGTIVAVVRAADAADVVPTAAVQVLTPEDALVTTLPHGDDGVARGSVPPGMYRVRVEHPEFVDVVRDVRVVSGGTAQLDIALTHRPRQAQPAPSPPPRAATTRRTGGGSASPGTVVDRSISAGRRFIGRLGF